MEEKQDAEVFRAVVVYRSYPARHPGCRPGNPPRLAIRHMESLDPT